MGKPFDFTTYLADEREKIEKSLTDEEKDVFAQRARGKGVVATSMALCQSERTVKRRSASIQRKIQRMHGMNRKTGEQFGNAEHFGT